MGASERWRSAPTDGGDIPVAVHAANHVGYLTRIINIILESVHQVWENPERGDSLRRPKIFDQLERNQRDVPRLRGHSEISQSKLVICELERHSAGQNRLQAKERW
jgi:hypothetical protein